MLRHRVGNRRLLGALLTALALAPLPVAAQLTQTGPDGVTRTEADLGTWDAVLVARGAGGQVVTAKGVEINTRGCDGRCIVTKLAGALENKGVDAPRSWWDQYDGNANRYHLTDARTGLADVPFGAGQVAPGASASAFPARPSQPNSSVVLAGARGSRTSVDHPSADTRVVTLFRQQPNGTEAALFVVTYTRRK
jgi:hypothetical protein